MRLARTSCTLVITLFFSSVACTRSSRQCAHSSETCIAADSSVHLEHERDATTLLQSRTSLSQESQTSEHDANTLTMLSDKLVFGQRHFHEAASQLLRHAFLFDEVVERLSKRIEVGCGSPAAPVLSSTSHDSVLRTCQRIDKETIDLFHNQDSIAKTKAVYDEFVEKESASVLRYPVNVADPLTTDRVAVIVLLEGLHASNDYMENNVEYVIRSVSHRLGGKWALQIFHAPGHQSELSEALGNPKNVIWSVATMKGRKFKSSRSFYNRFRWSTDFYTAIDPAHEHVLIFELDSMLLRSNCIEEPEFFRYAIVGAPHSDNDNDFRPHFVNGGFTLRRRSSQLKAINYMPYEDTLKCTDGNTDEDGVANCVFTAIEEQFAPTDLAARFAFEQIPSRDSCAFHKPWVYSTINASFLESMLDDVAKSESSLLASDREPS